MLDPIPYPLTFDGARRLGVLWARCERCRRWGQLYYDVLIERFTGANDLFDLRAVAVCQRCRRRRVSLWIELRSQRIP